MPATPPTSAFRRPPEPAAAAAWFAGVAGQAILASEADSLRQAALDRPGQAGLWLCPSGMGEGEVELPLLRLRAAARGFEGDVRCGLPLPLPSDCCGVVVVQHLADISADPAALLEECARVLVPGGRLWLLALNPLSPYRLRWRGQGPRVAEPVTWRRRLRAVGLAPDAVSRGLGPTWSVAAEPAVQDGAGLRAAFLLRAEKRRTPLTPMRAPAKARWQPGMPTA
ncbi:class I SAM-dependent methyltransferase [Thermomonas aquatica]|jgi:SAM-dependent methyltransferase|uniref:Class I SAM-dependent methyltransferase n=1 Tax=Thermomonas aquatica TaxID=2202149 RepID=A0A5B7ZPD7_9GAMM|nr:methyltransferase domain-containing protein [Thermomonas aquatica]QDA56403.1 class I SAM-dependent methyltransferase [Thermomonas aquatica]